jgi:hypothetical protein
LVISSRKKEGGLPTWVKLKDGRPGDIFIIDELRDEKLSFNIPVQALSAGTETYLEIGDTELGPRSLALSPYKLSMKPYFPIINIQPRVILID